MIAISMIIIMQEWNCSVCSDNTDYPILLSPCGHSIGDVCSKKTDKCPICKTPIESRTPNYYVGSQNNLELRQETATLIEVACSNTANRMRVEKNRKRWEYFAKFVLIIAGLSMVYPVIDIMIDRSGRIVESAECQIIDCKVIMNPNVCLKTMTCIDVQLYLQLNDYQFNTTIEMANNFAQYCDNNREIDCYYQRKNPRIITTNSSNFSDGESVISLILFAIFAIIILDIAILFFAGLALAGIYLLIEKMSPITFNY